MKPCSKSVCVSVFVAASVIPVFASAAWWNPASWFSKEAQVDEWWQVQLQNLTSNNTTSESQVVKSGAEAKKNQNLAIPTDNLKPSEIKTIEDLKAEVATLKMNLDSLYKAHNGLVEDHNQLLKITNNINAFVIKEIQEFKTANTKIDTSGLEWKIANLKNQIEGGSGIIGLNSRVTDLENKAGLLPTRTSPSLDKKISDLESAMRNIYYWTFGGLDYTFGYPTLNPDILSRNIVDRIKKLEGGAF